MVRLTDKYWRNFDPWEFCGQDHYCQRGCHDEGGCIRGCIVPKLYARLAEYEDIGFTPEEIISLNNRAHDYSFALSETQRDQNERDRFERGTHGVYG